MDGPVTVPIKRDPFEILGEAGSGGMGIVYRARERATGRLIALKMLNVDGVANRFTLEARVLASLKHPAIVEYVTHGVADDGRQYLAMEWLDGECLEDRIEQQRLSLAETLRIARVIADALDVAHAAGVVHRDLKPSNVFVTTSGEIKLLDFGIAKSVEVEGLTSTGQVLGTPGYMSPEQARGGAVDGRSDLFSLGCLVFRVFSGTWPFAGADLMSFVTKLALEDPPLLRAVAPGAPRSLEILVDRLLAKDPEARFATAALVREEIDRIVRDISLTDADTTVRNPNVEGPPPAEPPLVEEHATAPLAVAPVAPVVPSPSLPPPAAPRGGGGRVVGIVVAISLVAAGLIAVNKMGSARPPASAGIASASASASAALAPLVRDADRVALGDACREWSSRIARGQRADGAFSGQAHADPSGWDTAQQLFSLTEARRACGAVAPGPLAAGARALVKLRVDDGWIGPRRPTAPNFEDRRAETPGIAWAVLALGGVVRETSDPAIASEATRARGDLLRARLPDGGFRFIARGPGVSTLYSTILAAWALLETGPANAPLDAETKDALAWLRRELASSSEAIRTQGVTEQIGWLLARAERRQPDPAARVALRAAATEIVAQCRLDGVTCRRPTSDTGKIALDADAGGLVTLWHPWATLSAYELVREPRLDLDATTAGGLRHVTQWGNAELGGAVASLATAPEYKLSEYLVVVAKTLEP